MKLETNYGKVEGRGIVETNAFKMKASPVAFEILSKSLYSDPKRAVLREVGCNAYDGHVAAGCPEVPFEVKLPNSLDPNLYIKDFGIGLDHEEVVNLMTTYFSSSKSTSNDFIGCMGLGSKSPFAYTDSFTIVANKNGVSRTYVAYKGESGEPQVSLMAEGDVELDWPTGVMVGFPVKPEHHGNFVSLASEVFRYFKVPPRVVGAAITFVKPDYHIKGSNFGLKLSGTSMVTMGNVAYPLKVFETSDEQIEKFLKMFNIDLALPIGAVAVAASREELHYDKHTLKSLEVAVKGVISELTALLVKAHDEGGDTVWKKRQALVACLSPFGGYARQTFAQLLTQIGKSDLAKMVESAHVPLEGKNITGFSGAIYRPKRRYRGNKRFVIERIELREAKGLPLASTPLFVINDSKRAEQRARFLVDDDNLVVFLTKTHIAQDQAEFLANAQAFLDMLGNPDYIMSSSVTLPDLSTAAGVSASTGRTGINRVSKSSKQLVEVVELGNAVDSKRNVEVDVDDGETRLYLYKDKGRFRMGDELLDSFYEFSAVLEFLGSKVGSLFELPGDGNVYLLTPTQAAKVADKPNWLSLPELLTGLYKDPEVISRFEAAKFGNIQLHSHFHEFLLRMDGQSAGFVAKEVLAGTGLGAQLQKLLELKNSLNVQGLNSITHFQSRALGHGAAVMSRFLMARVTAIDCFDKLMEHYPLITLYDLNQALIDEDEVLKHKHIRAYLLASDALQAIETRKGQMQLDLGGLHPEVEKQVRKAA